jgi:hypothetical protein
MSFAGLLATLAGPPREKAVPEAAWSESDLGEDVVKLSYDHALRAHARYKPADSGDRSHASAGRTELGNAEPDDAVGPAIFREAPGDDGMGEAFGEATSEAALEAQQRGGDRDLRSTSVTIRLSSLESAQLHKRAAEAGVTVSAYLRSCTFEAEALRAQVKTALAELRAATQEKKPGPVARQQQAFGERLASSWIARYFPKRRLAGQPI